MVDQATTTSPPAAEAATSSPSSVPAGEAPLPLPQDGEGQPAGDAATEGTEEEQTQGEAQEGEEGTSAEGTEGNGEAGEEPEGTALAPEKGKKPPEKEEPKHKFEFEGKDYEMTPSELIDVVKANEAKVKEANEAIEYSNKVVTSANKFITDMREDWRPTVMRVLLQKHGGDEGKAWEDLIGGAKRVISEALEWEKMSPEKREAIQAKRETQKAQTELERLRGERQQQEQLEAEARGTEEIVAKARPVLKAAGLPQDEKALKILIDTYRWNRSMGRKVSLDACAKLIKEESTKRQEDLLRMAQLDPEAFLDKFPDHAKRINDAILRRVKRGRAGVAGGGAPGNGALAAPGQASAPKEEPIAIPSGLSTREFFAELDRQTSKGGKRKKP